jgi:hypothetical protein
MRRVSSSAIAVIGPIVGEGQLLVPLRSLEHPLRRTTAVLLPEDSTRPIPDIGSTGLGAQKLTLVQSSNEGDVAAGPCSRWRLAAP